MTLASCLDSASLLEQARQFALLALQMRVSANMLLSDEDVGNGGLARHVFEGGLDG